MVCFRNKEGLNAHEICVMTGTSYSLIWKQLDRGLSLEEAFKHVQDRKGKRYLNHAHHFYKGRTIRSYCKDDKEYHRVLHRYLKGISVEEAFKQVGVKYDMF